MWVFSLQFFKKYVGIFFTNIKKIYMYAYIFFFMDDVFHNKK